MEPQIRYVHSADGASIATRTLGVPSRRPDVVVMPSAGTTTAPALLTAPEIRAGLERLAESRRVILFDARGTGLSDRDVADFSAASWLADIQAVIVEAADGHADLIAPRGSSPMAIAYAASHSEQVRRLILVDPIAYGLESAYIRGVQKLSPLIEFDFEMYQRHAALEIFGWTETGRRVAEGLKGTVSRDVWRANDSARRELDVSDLLPALRRPTLVLQYTAMDEGAREAPRRIASRIPGARLATIHSAIPLLFAFDPEGDASLVLNFLDEDVAATTAAPAPQGTAIILFTDIVDSTAQTERLGDADFRSQARAVDQQLRAIIDEHAGTVIDGKLLGDGVMAVFHSASRAVECALACHGATIGTSLALHVGLHAGDVIHEQGNVFGGAVNIASRISSLSAPGEVLVSDIVRGLARTSARVTFEDRGEHALKGIAPPVRVFAVRSRE